MNTSGKYNCLAVIPARYESSRLPGKPLKIIAGKSLLQRVWEQAKKSQAISRVIVATDDNRIKELAEKFGAEVLMTRPDHPSGSDRVAEIAWALKERGDIYKAILNVQGDMPFIHPDLIDRVISDFSTAGEEFGIGTVAIPINDPAEFTKESVVKVVFDKVGKALYFSRAPIPNHREKAKNQALSHRHIGLYIYRPEVLMTLTKLAPTQLEHSEKLEQLRALEHGIHIKVTVVSPDLYPSIEVDTPEDLERAEKFAAGDCSR